MSSFAPRYASISDARAAGAICSICRVTGAERKLMVCARCKSVKYCSRDCQKEAWKHHKVMCMSTDDAHALLDNLASQHNGSPLVLALHDKLDMKAAIQEWCEHRSNRAVLNWTCFNAFDLRHHPERSTTHVMLIQLKLTGNNQTAKKKVQSYGYISSNTGRAGNSAT